MKTRCIFFCGLLLALSQVARAQEPETEMVQPVDVYIRSAKIALATNPPEYDRALKNLYLARKNYPENYQVHFLLGSIWADKDEIDSMIVEYGLARKYAADKEWDKIAKNLDKILEGKWLERVKRAVTLLNQLDSTEELASSADDTVRGDSLRAVVAEIRRMAKEALRQSAMLRPRDFLAYSTRGLIYQRQGMIDSCIADFVNAEDLFHQYEFGDSTTNWYDTSAFFSGPDGAPTALFTEYQKKYTKLSDEKRTRYRLMLISLSAAYYDAQKWSETVAISRRFYGLDPNDINTIVTMADVFSRLGKDDEAFRWQEVVVRRDPGSKDTWYNMGIFYYNTAVRLQDSVLRYEREVQSDPKNQAGLTARRDFTSKRLENFCLAIPRFQKVVEIDPKDQDTWRLLATCYYSIAFMIDDVHAAGNNDDAAQFLASCWKSVKNSEAEVADRMTLWADAEQTLQKATAYFPEDQNLCYMMKVTLAQLGRLDDLNTWKEKCP